MFIWPFVVYRRQNFVHVRMATRRSRLQVKPNIGGGAKGPAVKSSAPKSPVKSLSIEPALKSPPVKPSRSRSPVKSPSSDLGLKSPLSKPVRQKSPIKSVNSKEQIEQSFEVSVKSPPRIMSPRRSISEKKALNSTDSNSSNTNITTTETCFKEGIGGADKVLSTVASPDSKSGSEKSDTEKDAEQSKLLSVPTRERFRRFGKVNVAAARGVTKSPALKDSKVSDEKTDKRSEDLEVNNEKTAPESLAGSRRSRLPKAKPNIDAGKRKQKESAGIDIAEQHSSSQDSTLPVVPEISVTPDVSIGEAVTVGDSSVIIEANTNMGTSAQSRRNVSPQPVVSTQFKPQAAPSSVPKSPLKPPAPNIFMSPEKRARTLSTSELSVVKRQRRPKVNAPTDQPPDRTTMKIRDMIRWNPSNNPMKHKANTTKVGVVETEKEKENENQTGKEKENENQSNKESEATAADTGADNSLPVPQVTIGPDGNIVINEKSLVLKDPELDKAPSQEDEIIDETEIYTTYGSFRKKRHIAKRWTKKETKKFYKALAMIGIDFFLISQLFPKRTRLEIKKKFQKEERMNRPLVERVLKGNIKLDPSVFDAADQDDSSDEEEDEKEKKPPKKKPKEPKEQQNTAKKKPIRRRNKPLNYYEDETTSEDEEEPPKKKPNKNEDGPWQPPTVSRDDGEVVGILMDMSKGQGQSNVGGPENVFSASGTEIYTAVPVSKQKIGHKTKSALNTSLPGQTPGGARCQVLQNTKLDTSQSSYSQAQIPGVDSVSVFQTQQAQSSGTQEKTRIILPVFNRTADLAQSVSHTQTGLPNYQTSQSLVNQSQYLNPGQSELEHNSLQQNVNNSNQMQINLNPLPASLIEDSALPEDQYVLVTVVPEGGGETVIHIYKLHGSQNLVSETDSPPLYQEIQLGSAHDQSGANVDINTAHVDIDQSESHVTVGYCQSDASNPADLQLNQSSVNVDEFQNETNSNPLASRLRLPVVVKEKSQAENSDLTLMQQNK